MKPMAQTKNLVVQKETLLQIELTADQLVDVARQLRYNVCFCEHEKATIAGKTGEEIQKLLMTVLETKNIKEISR